LALRCGDHRVLHPSSCSITLGNRPEEALQPRSDQPLRQCSIGLVTPARGERAGIIRTLATGECQRNAGTSDRNTADTLPCPLVQGGDRLCIDTDEILPREVRFLRARSSALVRAALEPLSASSKAVSLRQRLLRRAVSKCHLEDIEQADSWHIPATNRPEGWTPLLGRVRTQFRTVIGMKRYYDRTRTYEIYGVFSSQCISSRQCSNG
jgi:hypothetical protein